MARYDRDSVLAAVDLADVLTRELGPPTRVGSEWWWPSVDPAFPGTGRTPPTHIIPRGGRAGPAMFKDFASGASGTAIDVIMTTRSVDFPAALQALAVEHGIKPQTPPSHSPGRRANQPTGPARITGPATHQAPPTADQVGVRRPPSPEVVAWVHDCADRLATSRSRGAGRARAWLRRRGFADEFLADNLVGYDPGARHDRHRPAGQRKRHGIPKMPGVTLPHFDTAGQVTYVQTRNVGWTPGGGYPKYVNPAGALNPRFGIWADPDPQHRAGAPVLVTEGPTDSLTARQAGFDVAGLIGATHAEDPATAAALTATLGTDRPYVVVTDPDPAGRRAGQLLVVHLWINGAVALHRPPPLDGDLADWAAAAGPAFPAALGAHIGHALAGASTITRLALAGDCTFITRAAGGDLTPAAAEVWASYLTSTTPDPATRRDRREPPRRERARHHPPGNRRSLQL